jgi:hypothetical protein
MSVNNQADHHQYATHLHHLNSLHSNQYTSLNHHHNHHGLNGYSGAKTTNGSYQSNLNQFLLDTGSGSGSANVNLLGTYSYNGNNGHYTSASSMDPSSLFIDTKQMKVANGDHLSPIKLETGDKQKSKSELNNNNGSNNVAAYMYQSLPGSFNSTASSSNPSETSSISSSSSSSSPSNSSSPTISSQIQNTSLVNQSNNNSNNISSKTFASLSSTGASTGVATLHQQQSFLPSSQPMTCDTKMLTDSGCSMGLFDSSSGQDPIIEYNQELAESIEYELGLKKQNGPRFVLITNLFSNLKSHNQYLIDVRLLEKTLGVICRMQS